MLTERERTALDGYGETVTLPHFAYGHIGKACAPYGVLNRAWIWECYCGEAIWEHRPRKVSLSDLRLGAVKPLCEECAKALGLKGDRHAP